MTTAVTHVVDTLHLCEQITSVRDLKRYVLSVFAGTEN